MLYSFILNFVDIFSFLNLFKYLTVRTGLAMFTSMFVVFLVGTPFINFFSAKQILSPIREDGPTEHIVKKNRHSYHGRSFNFIRIILWSFFFGVIYLAHLFGF